MSQKTEPKVDMSEEAIARRLAEVAALNRLCESLGKAGKGIEAEPNASESPAPQPQPR